MRALVFASVLVLGSAGSAFAGGCPTCVTNQDCVDQGAGVGALCVEWFDDFGCGTQRIACCPGQGCALQNGEPSCVATNDCRRVDAVAPDAGPLDQGQVDLGDPDQGPADVMPGPDAGPSADVGAAADGSQNSDSGPAVDAAAGADTGPAVDSGAGSSDDDEGCGCRAPKSPTSGVFWLGGFAVLAWLRRRR